MMNMNYIQLPYLNKSDVKKIKELELICSKEEDIFFKLELDYKLKDGEIKQQLNEDIYDNEFFCYYNDQLVGYIGISIFGNSEAEVCGMIHPNFRRKQLFTKMITKVEYELTKRGHERYLLLADANSSTAAKYIRHISKELHHIEYEMKLPNHTVVEENDEDILLVLATNDQIAEIHRQDVMGFGDSRDLEHTQKPEDEILRGMEIYMVQLEDEYIGKINLRFNGESGWIFGFVLDPLFRGRQLGKAALKESIKLMRQRGVKDIFLQVDSKNPIAKSLYEKVGFEELYAMEYYEIEIKKPKNII